MDSLIFELQVVFYFQLFLSANVRHIDHSRNRPALVTTTCESRLNRVRTKHSKIHCSYLGLCTLCVFLRQPFLK